MSDQASHPSNVRRALMLVVGLLASIITLTVGAQVALAHHSEISATADCTPTVNYTATSWTTGSSGANTKIQVGYRIGAGSNVHVAYGAFGTSKPGSNPAVPDSFSGTFAWPASNPSSIIVFSKPINAWGNGTVSTDGRETTVTRPAPCPAVPGATIVGSCVNNVGKVAVTLTNTGGTDVTLTVQFNGGGIVSYNVPKNGSTNVPPFAPLANGSYPVVVKKSSTVVAQQTIVVACHPAAPAATIVGSCVNNAGKVAVTLSNTGDFDVTLTLNFNGTITSHLVAKNSTLPVINFPGLANGSYPVVVKNGQTTVASQTIVVACHPAAPAATIVGTCVNNAGNVAVTLSNTGDFDVTLTVQFNGGAATPYLVPKNGSYPVINFPGLANGSYPVVVKNGQTTVASQTIVVACHPAAPAATIVGSCVNNQGNVAVTLSNTGDFDFTLNLVFNNGAPAQFVIPKNSTLPTINFSNLANGSYPVLATNAAPGVNQTIANQTIVVACRAANPDATIVGSCVNNLGNVAVTLSNTGDFDVTLTLNFNGTVTSHLVPKNSSLPVINFPNLDNGSYPVVVSNGETVIAEDTIAVACKPGTGTGTIAHECSNYNGTVTITLTHTGGDFKVDFVVDGVTYTIQPGGAPQTVVYSNVPDGPFNKVVNVNGVDTPLSVTVACDAALTAAPICNEVDVNNVVTAYWYKVTNLGPADVPITWVDGSAVVPGAGSVNIKSAAPSATVKNGEITAVTVQSTTDVCGTTVKFSKSLLGQPPTGETYTIRVSRLVAPNYVTYLTFDIEAGIPKEFELPSTLEGTGVQYKIEEINTGTASLHTVSPDSFSLVGNLGETVSVVVTNGYAAVEIDKQVSSTTAKAGETLTYTLVATNTGGLTLNPVVISDLLPTNLSMVSALVAGDKGECVLTVTSRPQLISCDLDDALAPGASTVPITIVAQLDDDTPVGSNILNQAKVLGTYVGAPNSVTGLTEMLSGDARVAEVARLRAEAVGDLSCEPVVAGTVCDLSAKVGSLVEDKTASEPPVVNPAAVPPADPVLEVPALTVLPATGTSGVSAMLTIAFVLTCLGGLALFARRRTSRRSHS